MKTTKNTIDYASEIEYYKDELADLKNGLTEVETEYNDAMAELNKREAENDEALKAILCSIEGVTTNFSRVHLDIKFYNTRRDEDHYWEIETRSNVTEKDCWGDAFTIRVYKNHVSVRLSSYQTLESNTNYLEIVRLSIAICDNERKILDFADSLNLTLYKAFNNAEIKYHKIKSDIITAEENIKKATAMLNFKEGGEFLLTKCDGHRKIKITKIMPKNFEYKTAYVNDHWDNEKNCYVYDTEFHWGYGIDKDRIENFVSDFVNGKYEFLNNENEESEVNE